MEKRLIRFALFTYKDNPRIHRQRDCALLIELLPFLWKNNYKYYDSIFNYPEKKYPPSTFNYEFSKDDLIIITTRPPLHDDKQINKVRKIYKTGHPIEDYTLKFIKKHCFAACSRNSTRLKKSLATKLPKEYTNRAQIFYRIKKCADYDRIKRKDSWSHEEKPPKNVSSGFIIFIKASKNFPKILFVFGIGGAEGLIFSRLLNNGLWDQLKFNFDGNSRFIQFELSTNYIGSELDAISNIDNLHCKKILDSEIDC